MFCHMRRVALSLIGRRFINKTTRCSYSGLNKMNKMNITPNLNVIHNNFISNRSFSTDSNVIDFVLADIGEGIAEVKILQWMVKPGDHVNQFDLICEVQSDKANVEITSRYDGEIVELCHEVDEMARVGSALVRIRVSDEDSEEAGASSTPVESNPEISTTITTSDTSATPSKSSGKVLATPAVRRIAKEKGIDLSQVPATGRGGRITKEDILNFTEGKTTPVESAPPSSTTPAAPVSAPVIVPKATAEDTVESVTGFREVMVRTMNAANAVPTFLYCDEIEMDNLIEFRKILKETAAKHDLKLTYMPFLMKATSLAILDQPRVNAYANEDCSSITVKGAHNISLAMDTPNGLIVPNVKNVEQLSILEIASELQRLQDLGMRGKLGPNDLQGGTITLSNVGAIGGTYASPLLVVPQVCIGALGKFQTLPRFDANMNVKPTTILNVSWSADHRALAGAEVARFSNAFKGFVENPEKMLLYMK